MLDPKLLIIDDQEAIIAALSPIISRLGYDVVGTTDPKQGIHLAIRESPPIVLTDFIMPDMDGLEVVRKIMAHGRGTQIIIMTGRIEPINAIDAYQAGASDYLHKPIIDFEELTDVLNRAKIRYQRWRKIVADSYKKKTQGTV